MRIDGSRDADAAELSLVEVSIHDAAKPASLDGHDGQRVRQLK